MWFTIRRFALACGRAAGQAGSRSRPLLPADHRSNRGDEMVQEPEGGWLKCKCGSTSIAYIAYDGSSPLCGDCLRAAAEEIIANETPFERALRAQWSQPGDEPSPPAHLSMWAE